VDGRGVRGRKKSELGGWRFDGKSVLGGLMVGHIAAGCVQQWQGGCVGEVYENGLAVRDVIWLGDARECGARFA
jgi:hypothetical protein